MKKSEFKVGFCYNAPPAEFDPTKDDDEKYAEFDSKETIETISASLYELGYKVEHIEFDEKFIESLKRLKPDLIFNITEGFRGEDREAQAPAIFEWLGLKYTGSGPLTKCIALNKHMAKIVWNSYGIKSAPFQVFDHPINDLSEIKIELPAIVKCIHEGSSIGLHNDNYVTTKEALKTKVNWLIDKYNQAALVEKYIEGREFNQALIGNEPIQQFPIVEIDYDYLPSEYNKFSSFEVKTFMDDPNSTVCPARITPEEAEKISKVTLAAYKALGTRDYARIDLRLGKDGEVYLLELNTVPGIAPGIKENNSMPKAIRKFGWTYTQMIGAIMDAALKRYGITLEEG